LALPPALDWRRQLSSAIIEVLSAYGESIVPRVDGAVIDGAVLSFSLVCAIACVAAFGLLPSLHAAREHGRALQDTSRVTSGGRGSRRMRSSLMIAEVSLSVALLIGAGLLLRSFIALQQVDAGFDVDAVMTARVLPASAADVNTYEKRRAFWARVTAEVSALPGITGVATTSAVPFSARNTGTEIAVPGVPDPPGARASSDWRMVSPGYFASMGIPLQGRDFTEADGPDAPPVIIVSEALARQYWPNESAVGKTIIPGSFGNRERTIIGVAGDVRSFGLDGDNGPMIYYSGLEAAVIFDWMYLVWRSAVDPESLISPIRDAIHRVNPEIAFYDIVPASRLLSNSFQARRFNLYLLGLFAAVAMVLAVVGLFSVMVYLVSQQTREIGVRLAVGATRASVFVTVIGRGMALAATGAGIGVVAAVWLTRLLESLLFSVSRTDPLIFTAVPAAMITVAVIACYVPARRAMRVDPMSALRVD
jgi:predicted permease